MPRKKIPRNQELQQEAARDLYRAWRTYDEAQRAIDLIRHDLDIVINDDEDYSPIMYHVLMHAKYHLTKHGFFSAAMINTVSLEVLDALADAMAWEVVEGTSVDSPAMIPMDTLYFEDEVLQRTINPLIPFEYGFYPPPEQHRSVHGDPYVIVNLRAFQNTEKMMGAVQRELPELRHRLNAEMQESQQRFSSLLDTTRRRLPDTRGEHFSLATLAPQAHYWASYRADMVSMSALAKDYWGNEDRVTTISRKIKELEKRHRVTRLP